MTGFNEYMRAVAVAAGPHTVNDGPYCGVDGCKRLAREVGAALPNFSRNARDLQNMRSSTYSGVCVIAYHLKPPIDSKVWLIEMQKGIEKALAIVPVPKPDDYKPAKVGVLDEVTVYTASWQ